MAARSLKLDAAGLYRRGLTENLRFDHRRQAVTLDDSPLVEDAAAGCGWPFEQDILGPEVRIRKLLTVDSPAAGASWPTNRSGRTPRKKVSRAPTAARGGLRQ